MSYLHTIRSGWENMRIADVTVADSGLIDGSGLGVPRARGSMPSHAVKIGQEYNGIQIWFSAGKGFGEGLHEMSALATLEAAFQIDGWYSSGPAFKICDGTVVAGESAVWDVTTGHEASEAIACSSIVVDDSPHPTAISIHNVDATNGIASITFDTIGMEWIAITFPDVSIPVNAWMRPY